MAEMMDFPWAWRIHLGYQSADLTEMRWVKLTETHWVYLLAQLTETHWEYLLAQLTELQRVLKREMRWAGP